MKIALIAILAMAAPLVGCTKIGDPNAEATYGESTGLPKNCRAIIQANIDSWRAREFTAEEAMNSMERNCGKYGHSWGQ